MATVDRGFLWKVRSTERDRFRYSIADYGLASRRIPIVRLTFLISAKELG